MMNEYNTRYQLLKLKSQLPFFNFLDGSPSSSLDFVLKNFQISSKKSILRIKCNNKIPHANIRTLYLFVISGFIYFPTPLLKTFRDFCASSFLLFSCSSSACLFSSSSRSFASCKQKRKHFKNCQTGLSLLYLFVCLLVGIHKNLCLQYDYILDWPVLIINFNPFHFVERLHSADNAPKNCVLVVQMFT